MIAVLAEGKGDREAGPQLARRILQDRLLEYRIQMYSKAMATRGKGELLKNFEDLLRLLSKRDDCEAVLVLVDSDNDCAPILAKELSERAKAISPMPVAIVCPVKEFENWFLCSAESICQSSAIPSDCDRHSDAKGWLNKCLPGGYRSTLHQSGLVWKIDLERALPRSRSLRRMVSAIEQLVEAIHRRQVIFTP